MSLARAHAALEALKAGNQRFINGTPQHPHQERDYRRSLISEQHPFATILGCSDSRVSPQIIFDQGLGDLFVNRIAGHLVDDAIAASIAYSVERLGVPLVVVLGHSGCGAVASTVAHYQAGSACSDPLSRYIFPAVVQAARQPGELLDNAINANVRLTVAQLRAHPNFEGKVARGELLIVGAVYDLSSGEVRFEEVLAPT